MPEDKRSHGREREECEEHEPQSVRLTSGTATAPRSFIFSAPSRRFASELNKLLMVLPDVRQRAFPEEEGAPEGLASVTRKVGDYVCTTDDYLVCVDASAGPVVISLPSTTNGGLTLLIVKTDSGALVVKINAFGNDLIQGSASVTLSTQWDHAVLIADGISTWIRES